MTQEYERNEANVPHTQPDGDDRGPVEYLRVVVEKQLYPSIALDRDEPAGYDAEQSELFLTEYATDQDGTRRLRLRLQHPDSTESDIGPMLSPAEMDIYLRGLVAGERGDIGRKADLLDDAPDTVTIDDLQPGEAPVWTHDGVAVEARGLADASGPVVFTAEDGMQIQTFTLTDADADGFTVTPDGRTVTDGMREAIEQAGGEIVRGDE